MDDYQFQLLQVKAAVCPTRETWPSPEVKVSIMGDKPTITGGALLWSDLHAAVDDARACVTNVFAKCAAVDDDKNLSPDGKASKKRAIAEDAIAGLSKLKSLDKARGAVEQQMLAWDKESGLAFKPPADVGEAVQFSEIRAHLARVKAVDRVSFVTKHANDARVVQAVLGAPAFLSGLTDAEIDVVRQQLEKRVAPHVASARAAALKALQEAEAGRQSAISQIGERAGSAKVLTAHGVILQSRSGLNYGGTPRRTVEP